MNQPIDFYFDFSSPFGYFAACEIDALGARHGRPVAWHPYLMGVAMKATGRAPLIDVPMVAEYSRRDMARCARLAGVAFQMPEKFPVAGVRPCRAYYWLEARERDGEADDGAARALALALLRAYFAEGRDISDEAVVVEIGADQGVEADALAAGLGEQAVKDRLRDETDAAIARGVFGSPFVVVDDEPFWGHDRLTQVERWLETGGW